MKQISLALQEGDVEDDDAAILHGWYTLRNNEDVSAWHDTFLMVACVPASSAAVERLFSFLRRMFDDSQTHALSDYIGAAVRLRYNKRTA